MIERLGVFLAIGCGSGLIRPAPGTWGSIVAVFLAYPIVHYGGDVALLVAATTASVVGIWAADVYERRSGKSDASEVVIDEWAGQWLALLPVAHFAPNEPLAWASAFGLFRLFDILKPGPIGLLDKKLKGGLGVMADDVLAGLAAGIVLAAGLIFLNG